MAIFRQYIAPLIVVLIFLLALMAVSVRIFLPADMAAPAPVEEIGQSQPSISQPPMSSVAKLPVSLDVLVDGLPQDVVLEAPL